MIKFLRNLNNEIDKEDLELRLNYFEDDWIDFYDLYTVVPRSWLNDYNKLI